MTQPDDDGVRNLDLTDEKTDPVGASPTILDLEGRREDARKTLATGLLLGLGAVIVGWVAVGLVGGSEEASNALRTAFTGLLGLTGTVVGFYFGGGVGNNSRQ